MTRNVLWIALSLCLLTAVTARGQDLSVERRQNGTAPDSDQQRPDPELATEPDPKVGPSDSGAMGDPTIPVGPPGGRASNEPFPVNELEPPPIPPAPDIANEPVAEPVAPARSAWFPLLTLAALPVIATLVGGLLFAALTWTGQISARAQDRLRRWGRTIDGWMPDRWLARLIGNDVRPPEIPPQTWWKAVPTNLAVGAAAGAIILVLYERPSFRFAALGGLWLYCLAAGIRLVGNPPARKWMRALSDPLSSMLPLLAVVALVWGENLGRELRAFQRQMEPFWPYTLLATLTAVSLAQLPWVLEAILGTPLRDPVLLRTARFLDRWLPDRLIDWLLADRRGPSDWALSPIVVTGRVWERMLGVLLMSHLAAWLLVPLLPGPFQAVGALILLAAYWVGSALRHQPFERDTSPPWLIGAMLAALCGVTLAWLLAGEPAMSAWGIGTMLLILVVMGILAINLGVRLPAFLKDRTSLQIRFSAWSAAIDRYLPDRLFAPRSLPHWLNERPPRRWLIGTASAATLYFAILSFQDRLAAVSVLPLAEALIWSYPVLLAFAESRRLHRYSRIRVFFEMFVAGTAGFLAMAIINGLSISKFVFGYAVWINCTIAAAASSLVMFAIASFRRRRHPLYGWLLEPLEILADLTVPDQVLRRLWRRDKSSIAGIASLAAALALFLAGTYVATAEYRDAIRTGWFDLPFTDAAEAVLIVWFSYTPTNLLMLACLAAYLGLLTRRLIVEAGGRAAPRQPLQTFAMTILRGLLVYTLVLSAVAAFSLNSVLEAGQADYLGLAIGVSLLSYFAGLFSFSPPILLQTVQPADAVSPDEKAEVKSAGD